VKFSITRHAGSASPPDALGLLGQRLGSPREGVSFSTSGGEITATWREEGSFARTEDERAEVGRLAVLDALSAICERAPELKPDWFAVSVRR
jgi:hypothetical protein